MYSSPRADTGGRRSYSYSAPRSYGYSSRSYAYGSPRAYSSGARVYGGGAHGGVIAGHSSPRIIVGSRAVGVGPGRFYRPYYTFRPRVSLGFGLWGGFPIAYPYDYGYYDPYYSPGYPSPGYPSPGYPSPGYPDPYPQYPYPSTGDPGYRTSTPPQYPSGAAPYPPAYPPSSGRDPQYPDYPPTSGSVRVQPNQGQANTGGVSFEITPGTAEVFVDGSYVGTVDEFTPTTQPLGLTPGRHQVEIRAPGYRTMQFDADVVAGQVIPFQGAMER